MVHLDRTGRYQVTADCAPASEIINEPWFVLPPAVEYFYRQKHPGYRPLPPYAPGCGNEAGVQVMEFIYPTQGIKIFIPRDHTGELTRIIPEVVHRDPSAKIFWHLDKNFLGTTKSIHQIEILASPGDHGHCCDEEGTGWRWFSITG
jgi:penicillin-binding protein 1C